ncbi:hypothetical protein [Aureimonas sp. SK2]|uniref:hypothetical protein n=1 Tax=Aureimonas sp. SK2 TaxID=3015992 RepID=UPI0024445E09|nr:hypothetical protein [Aureimonas sp. SK2]
MIIGSKNVTTRAVEALMEGEAEAIARKCIEAAKQGDTVAMRLCLERVYPVRKGRPVPFALPKIEGIADVPKAGAAILKAVAAGSLSPDEGASLMSVVTQFRQSIEANEILERIAALEAANAR